MASNNRPIFQKTKEKSERERGARASSIACVLKCAKDLSMPLNIDMERSLCLHASVSLGYTINCKSLDSKFDDDNFEIDKEFKCSSHTKTTKIRARKICLFFKTIFRFSHFGSFPFRVMTC